MTNNLPEIEPSEENTFECLRCGAVVKVTARHCPKCGLNFYNPSEEEITSRTVQSSQKASTSQQTENTDEEGDYPNYRALSYVGSISSIMGIIILVIGVLGGLVSGIIFISNDNWPQGLLIIIGASIVSGLASLPLLAASDVIDWMMEVIYQLREFNNGE